MMHCVEKWNLLFALNDKGIAVMGTILLLL